MVPSSSVLGWVFYFFSKRLLRNTLVYTVYRDRISTANVKNSTAMSAAFGRGFWHKFHKYANKWWSQICKQDKASWMNKQPVNLKANMLLHVISSYVEADVKMMYMFSFLTLRGRCRHQNGWFFGKVPGGGVIFNPKIYIADFVKRFKRDFRKKNMQ